MTVSVPAIDQLATDAKVINTEECLKYLPQLTNVPQNQAEAKHAIEHIVAIITKETTGDDAETLPLVNQVVLNLSFRGYYKLLNRYELPDIYFGTLASGEVLTHLNECGFQMLFSILLTEQCQRLDAEELLRQCLHSMAQAVQENCNAALLSILKALNLLCKKFPRLELQLELPLEHIYHCLQSAQIGMREETLVLFGSCCKDATRAYSYFQLIAEFWPWTNRNKIYLLSGTLNAHRLQDFLALSKLDTQEFYAGLRLSLSYKSLLAASQYLVKTLSNQQSEELLQLSVSILTRGARQELRNFYSQWFGRIVQKDALFELLQQQPEIASVLAETNSLAVDCQQQFRLILIFSMFSRQIFAVSKLHFFKLSTELLTNCFKFELESQLLVFKFVIENLANFAIEDCLDFLLSFMQEHKSVECAQFRNTILGKMPNIINYVAKTFGRLHVEADGSTLESSIRLFFTQLQQIITQNMGNTTYQPKIFSLKLLEILLNSLYAQKVQKNAKNCILAHNQKLGQFLIEKQVFNAGQLSTQLLALLNDPLGFDDALTLIVKLLALLNHAELAQHMQLCKDICQNCNIDVCALSSLYAQVANQSFKAAIAPEYALKLYEFAYNALQQQLNDFKRDPLLTGRQTNHLFGYLNTINEIVLAHHCLLANSFKTLLALLEEILNIVLNMLNLANLRQQAIGNSAAAVASFQDMDESLQLLVEESSYDHSKPENSHEESRKFLLMSFWLTLKACCDLATSIGCQLATSSASLPDDLAALERCLQINVAVLTRCRHKGAIESAGTSIGKLTKCITTELPTDAKGYALLHTCLELLFDDGQKVSTTRRGAGFSIMFLHIVKNEEQRRRPILKRAVANILQRLKHTTAAVTAADKDLSNCDRLEALTLHYLCVLVKDTELREPMTKYYNEIMMAAIVQIDHSDWTVCNAALQLFGALIPKIVGQKQATEFEAPVVWEPSEITYSEIVRKLPKTCEYILEYCSNKSNDSTSTRSIILFLGFLAKVEHLRKNDAAVDVTLIRFRELMWCLLRHNSEKVRKLAAVCFVRAHEFRCDLPAALLEISSILFNICNENFFEGLIFTLTEGIAKMQHECKHTVQTLQFKSFMQQLQTNLTVHFKFNINFKLYTICKLLELFCSSVGFENQSHVVVELVKCVQIDKNVTQDIGYDMWIQRLAQLST